MVAWLVPTRPEGDYAVGRDWQGYTMLGLALLCSSSASRRCRVRGPGACGPTATPAAPRMPA